MVCPCAKIRRGGGTEADGSTSQMYCSYCYEGGEFLQPEMTAAEMKSLVKSKLKEMKVPGFLASFYASGVPKLKRWRS